MSTARRAAGPRALRLATRGSPLALVQSRSVAARLGAAGVDDDIELMVVKTSGDLAPDVPVERLAGRGAFVKEVQLALLDGRADLAVHSAKDLPSETPPGLVLASVPERADPRDALVGCTLAGLPTGAQVATGSVRRRAQLSWLRPDLTFTELRGNMRTRLDRARDSGAGVLACAALERLGLAAEVEEVLDPLVMVPQVGQGALAVECREDDDRLLEVLAAIDDVGAHRALLAERAFLGALGGGCTLPAGALARSGGDGALTMEAVLASADGHVLLRSSSDGADPVSLGTGLAAALLDGAGGRELEEWRR
ncbi:MAG TPA: hydroxymethylbilane synthase [Acidimicrobiaceae bacterium]|nr:hydroxymethylbilane synthase [Acidimicrobiaceae bacterium]